MVLVAALVVAVGFGAATVPSAAATEQPGRPIALTVDDLVHPLGLDPGDVFFGWHLGDTRRNAGESAYRIVVSRSTITKTGTRAGQVWDSHRVRSANQSNVAYGGPKLSPDSTYRWRVQTWDGSGTASPLLAPVTFETGLRDRDWKAQWIRRPLDTTRPDIYTYARTEARLASSPIVRARAYVSGDQQYEMYVNGTRVGKGEAYSYPDQQYYETLDVTKALKAGAANAIGLLTYWDGPTKGHPAGEPGGIVQISITHADGSTETVMSDGSWKVLPGNWTPGTQRDLEGDLVDFVENIDGRAEPLGWDTPGFDDTAWASAAVVGPAGTAPWTHLVSARTRIVGQPVPAVSLTKLPSGDYVADFGKVYAAVPTVTLHHGVSGRQLHLLAGFLLDPPGIVSGRGAQHTDMHYSYIERDGQQTFHPFDYLGFRYLEIDGAGEDLTAADVVALVRHTALPALPPATFHSSNATVDQVFDLGAHSAEFTAQEQFVDTPTREKGSWLFDGFNESVTDMDAFGEQNLARQSVRDFGASQARFWPNGAINKIYPTGLGALDINESTEAYVEWVWQYWMHTGDRATLATLYPVVSKVADYVTAAIDPTTHLVTNLPATNVYYLQPTVTRLNVLGVDVFHRLAQMGRALGRPASQVAAAQQRAATLTAAINARLTRPDGIYVDGLNADGSQVATASQSANACAVVFGVAPKRLLATIGAYIAGLRMPTPPQNAAEVLEALAVTGRPGDVVTRLTDTTTDGWAKILSEGATFMWEVWNPSDLIGDTMSHGWGANVLVAIQQTLLGVQFTGAGGATVSVAPPAGGLSSARGTVPTPHGTLSVSWHRATATSTVTTLDVTVPAGTRATVIMPASRPRHIGSGTWHLTSQGG
jgi:alpha-L-rhamnosidase